MADGFVSTPRPGRGYRADGKPVAHRHGHSGNGRNRSRTYSSWSNMVQRTTNFSRKDFETYGEVGIDPSFLGRGGFENFLREVGERPSRKHSIDRIDNTKGYFPGNLRWATRRVQDENRSAPTHYGRTVEEWAELLRVRPTTIRKRRERKWPDHLLFPHEHRLTEKP